MKVYVNMMRVKVKKAAHENEIVFKTGESYKIYDDKCKRVHRVCRTF